MFVIKWTSDRDTEKHKNRSEVQNQVDKIGNDGAILKWYDTSKSNGVIIYYNEIIGYVDYEADPLGAETVQDLRLNCALVNMTHDELVDMIKDYNNYILKVVPIRDVQEIKVKDLFTWLSINYLE